MSDRSARPIVATSWRWVPSPQSKSTLSPPRRTSSAGIPRRAVGTDPAVPAKNTERSTRAVCQARGDRTRVRPSEQRSRDRLTSESARSSGDRALASGARGRRCKSCRARSTGLLATPPSPVRDACARPSRNPGRVPWHPPRTVTTRSEAWGRALGDLATAYIVWRPSRVAHVRRRHVVVAKQVAANGVCDELVGVRVTEHVVAEVHAAVDLVADEAEPEPAVANDPRTAVDDVVLDG